MVCHVDYLTIEAWTRQRLNDRGERFEGVPVPKRCLGDHYKFLAADQPFGKEVAVLQEALNNLDPDSPCYLHPQTKLIDIPGEANDQVEAYLQRVLDQGGEGVVIRNPRSIWTPKRHRAILKYKPFQDAEARVVGFTSGRETSKGSRLLGKIGALIVDYQGKRLELAGLTDAEREFADQLARDWATSNPGADAPYWVESRQFKKGQTITFKYRELSDDGIPKEARYWRRRDAE
jgi:ATP-dependent DNA ligase